MMVQQQHLEIHTVTYLLDNWLDSKAKKFQRGFNMETQKLRDLKENTMQKKLIEYRR